MMIPHSNPSRQVAVELHLPGFAPVQAMAMVATDEIFLQPVHPQCVICSVDEILAYAEKMKLAGNATALDQLGDALEALIPSIPEPDLLSKN